ncbi:hypothetical protein Tco_0311864 [Tanacetum coccineum]
MESIYMDDSPSSLELWKNKFFFIDRRAIPNYLTWRSTKSCVSDDLPTDGYDPNDVLTLCARFAKLRDVVEVVLIRSGLSSAWLNQKCDPVFRKKDDNSVMGIYDFMTIPSWDDAEVVEEPHGFGDSILQCVENRTTAPTTEGTPISEPTPEEIVAILPDPKVAKKSKGSVKQNAPTSSAGPSEATQSKKKRN